MIEQLPAVVPTNPHKAVSRDKKLVLFFSYLFPPASGSGIQRSVGFVRYLPACGYEPLVVTAPCKEGGDTANAPLLTRFASGRVYRSKVGASDFLRKAIFGNGLVQRLPKSQSNLVWWVPSAVRECLNITAQQRVDLIYTSVNPWAGAAVGREVARRRGLPWVIDFRDPWAIDDLRTYLTTLHYQRDLRAMRSACRDADGIIMNTPLSMMALLEKFPELSREKVFCIPNGYDPDPMDGHVSLGRQTKGGPLHIVYSGELFTHWAAESDPENRHQLGYREDRWKYRITDLFLCRPGEPDLLCRSPYYFLHAVRLLLEKGMILPKDVRITIVGNVSTIEQQLTKQLGLEPMITRTGYVSHMESMSILSTADVLLLLQHKPRKCPAPLTVPGKLYEYLTYGKPILALVPQGDARHIVEQSGLGRVCEPDSVDAIAEALAELVEVRKGNTPSLFRPNHEYIAQFSRRKLTEQLANVFAFASRAKNTTPP